MTVKEANRLQRKYEAGDSTMERGVVGLESGICDSQK